MTDKGNKNRVVVFDESAIERRLAGAADEVAPVGRDVAARLHSSR